MVDVVGWEETVEMGGMITWVIVAIRLALYKN